MKLLSNRSIFILIGVAIGVLAAYLISEAITGYVARIASSDEEITRAGFLCVVAVFPLAIITGGALGNLLWKRKYGA